jgi:hypothetical protein
VRAYPQDRLFEEMAFVAYHFHWDQSTVLELEHRDRKRWCEEISRINVKMSDESRERPIDLGV